MIGNNRASQPASQTATTGFTTRNSAVQPMQGIALFNSLAFLKAGTKLGIIIKVFKPGMVREEAKRVKLFIKLIN